MNGLNEIQFFRKIGLKLILIVSLTVVSIIGVNAYFKINFQTNCLLAEVERHANQLSETIKNSTRYGMLLNQREYVDEIVKTIGQDKTIDNIRIYNKEGRIIYSSNPKDLGKMLDKKAESCYACHAENKPLERLPIKQRTRIFKLGDKNPRIMGIINPIYNEKSCYEADCHAHPENASVLGVLDITISLEEIDATIKRNEIQELIFTIVSILAIGIIISIFVKRWVDRPVKELIKATNQIAAGNLTYEIKEIGNDELGYLAKSFNNMTKKLYETQQQLFQSDKMASLGKLAAGVAHEINNPLTGVLTYSSYLMKRAKDNPELQEDLQVIVRETMRCRDIVRSLLDFSRQSSPKKNLININEIIERTESVVHNQLSLNNIKLTKILDSNLPQIAADQNQIQQVLLNLILNAIDAIGNEGGEIVIKTKQLTLPPKGYTHIKAALCPKNHNLIDNENKIAGMSSIRVKLKSGDNEGPVFIDPIYGRSQHYFGIPIEKNSHASIHCPVCDVSLLDRNSNCPVCGGPVFKFEVPGKGYVEMCASFNDDWQKWERIDNAGARKFVEIEISDNGCGIPQEHLSRIFEPFFTTKGQKGTGLGLSVVWGIIDNHDGSISVKSEPGSGTTFSIKLPAENYE
ncbi:integral membrane sensor signal transduction histidine kinase [Melioribacter roseus P3M-2]|uniref:histidine kinase n=1 Tax=Melioribacter roseus (strain DSM 23840 / JCM 17771 / VKM B-2668 / P3M-2) TaxID=1191523 RepID=I6Z6L5_MELRP|nr:HAMP domain-containing sensor histidine kinase [Melioribacter roseus]AFN74805.1 integral membrane sensor signal transduction histidine kinase [Melioribacter roseus P3M-2]